MTLHPTEALSNFFILNLNCLHSIPVVLNIMSSFCNISSAEGFYTRQCAFTK